MPWGTWRPTRLVRSEQVLATSMRTVVVMTDLGRGHLKAIGNPEGEHALASDLIGSHLAEWIGLETLEFSLLSLDPVHDELLLEPNDSVPIADRLRARPGPAFITRTVQGSTWGGDPQEFATLANRPQIAGLVVLDTWLGNGDRCPRRPRAPRGPWPRENLDNVLMAKTAAGQKKRRLVAMDFSHCLFRRDGALRATYGIDLVQDPHVYGAFDAFAPYLTPRLVNPFLNRLRDGELGQALVPFLRSIPRSGVWTRTSEMRSGDSSRLEPPTLPITSSRTSPRPCRQLELWATLRRSQAGGQP